MRSPSEGTFATDFAGTKARAGRRTARGSGPGGIGNGADAMSVSEVEAQRCRAQCGAIVKLTKQADDEGRAD